MAMSPLDRYLPSAKVSRATKLTAWSRLNQDRLSSPTTAASLAEYCPL